MAKKQGAKPLLFIDFGKVEEMISYPSPPTDFGEGNPVKTPIYLIHERGEGCSIDPPIDFGEGGRSENAFAYDNSLRSNDNSLRSNDNHFVI